VLVEISDEDVRAFAGIGDRHRPSDAAVATCDDRQFSVQLPEPR